MIANLSVHEEMVVKVIAKSDGNKLTATEIYNKLNFFNKIAQSTVYNSLRRLVSKGVLKKVLTLSNIAFYEVNSGTMTKHISFVYPKQIREFSDDRLNSLINSIAMEFEAELIDFEISVVFK